jgi:hypothetical protein
MKIAILGTRGIPNNHGGFEQFAEYLSVYLSQQGHEVYVYNSHNHRYQEKSYKGVKIIHIFDPEYKMGTAGQFVYDLKCILDSRKRKFDAILQLGYTSSSIWHWLMPKSSVIITNMDGMEWKRSKYSSTVKQFLKYAEKLAVNHSDFLIADSIGIQEYISKTYDKDSEFIAYGATVFNDANDSILSHYKVEKNQFSIIIARMEPENNIETIVKGFYDSKTTQELIIFGALNDYGKKLQATYSSDKRIRFLGANYNQNDLNNLRYYSRYYFHGHSVGGTNPSLLEAMASNTLIIANNNVFNKSILGLDAAYFDTSEDIKNILDIDTLFNEKNSFSHNNTMKINELYNLEKINAAYIDYILKTLNSN